MINIFMYLLLSQLLRRKQGTLPVNLEESVEIGFLLANLKKNMLRICFSHERECNFSQWVLGKLWFNLCEKDKRSRLEFVVPLIPLVFSFLFETTDWKYCGLVLRIFVNPRPFSTKHKATLHFEALPFLPPLARSPCLCVD